MRKEGFVVRGKFLDEPTTGVTTIVVGMDGKSNETPAFDQESAERLANLFGGRRGRTSTRGGIVFLSGWQAESLGEVDYILSLKDEGNC